MPNSSNSSNSTAASTPDYGKIARFLFEPLVDNPDTLRVDCEKLSSSDKVWVRIAFEQEDKGTVFGRGGRNLKAIETVLNTSTVDVNQTVHLDVYGNVREESSSSRVHSGSASGRGGEMRRTRSSASNRPRAKKPSPQLRSNNGE